MSYRAFGTLGFGLGGVIVGLSGDYMIYSFIIMGLLGGAFLTIPARDLKLTLLSAVLGAVGFFIGFAVPMFFILTTFEPPFPYLLTGIFMGLVGGLLLGIPFRSIKNFIIFGVIGFGIGFGLTFEVRELFRSVSPTLFPVILMVIVGIIGGGFLGQAATMAKKKKAAS